MTREELIKKVALKMDEISSSDDVIVKVDTSDNNPLYTQINNLLNESINDVLTKAPIYRLQGHISSVSNHTKMAIFGTSRYAVSIPVPGDFIRLVSVNDVAFQRPISELAIEGDNVDKMQHNRHLVAKNAKPVAVMCNASNGRVIMCYSYREDETPNPTMLYIKRYTNVDMAGDVELDEYMTDLVSWVCAGRVFAAQGDINKGKICDDNASSLMI